MVDAGQGESQLARVWSVVHAARRIADPCDPLGREARRRLPAASSLSAEGVELALSQHLETEPEARHVEQLAASASRAARCHVVLAANVCTAPLRALACALATAPQVRLRPSRQDPVVAELLVRALREGRALADAGGHVVLSTVLAPAAGDEVHLYGSDESLQQIQADLAPAIRVRAHGTGIGIAVVGPQADLPRAAADLAKDVVPFDQRGCLSPRFVLVDGEAPRAAEFGAHLHAALASVGNHIPRGPVAAADRSAYVRYRDAMRSVGQCWEGPQHAVAFDPSPQALLLAPAVRCVQVVPCDAKRIESLLGPWLRFITALGSTDRPGRLGPLAGRLRQLAPRARCSAVGRMQHPPLDGPVDLR